MQRRRALSLRSKVTAAVMAILVVVLGLLFSLQYRWVRAELIERLGLASAPLGDVIRGSLKHAMQTRDLSELAAIVDNVSRQDGVVKVFVVDKRGEIRFSPVKSEIGTRVPLGDPSCQVCHREGPANRRTTAILALGGGERVYRNVTPIANEPACFGCHPAAQKINGVLISDFSMAAIDRQLAAKFREMVIGLVVAVGAAALGITVLMNRLVIDKLERVVQATRLLGRGRLDVEVAVGPPDEVGELATSFNEMIEQLRRTQEVRDRQELLENVLDKVDDCVLVFRGDGVVVAFNHGAERAFGQPAADVVGRRPALLGEEHEALLERARTAGVFSTRLTLRAGARTFPARVHVTPLRDEAGALLAIVVVAQDLTEERDKERLQLQLVQSEKLAAMGRLAAGVAHELNNPLNNALLCAKLLLEDLPADDARTANARRVVDNTLRCKAIVRSLLDYARQSDVEMTLADMDELAESTVGLVAADLERHGVRCERRFAPDLPPVLCDRRQMQQVLVNLLRNGIEAIDGSGGTVRVFTAPGAAEDTVVLGVTDDGCGIAPEGLRRIFEPFYTTKEDGVGLGLALSWSIVERHHGRIRVETRAEAPDRGSTFLVELPVAERPA
ncbi:MAG TPA: ATP-binding protein [Methylomirabilota bacterium]|nr:ATP-binding protein [Methylomirabilota bacterium]